MTSFQKTPIVLDKPRHLLYNMNAFYHGDKKLTEYAGKKRTVMGFLGEINDENNQLSLGELLIILWCGLLAEDKSLRVEDVGEMAGLSDMMMVINTIVSALSINVPEPDDTEGKTAPLA